MLELNLRPGGEFLLFRPIREFSQQGGISSGRVFGLPALVAQVLQKIFDQVLHRTGSFAPTGPFGDQKEKWCKS
jgi:hypothetical protein